jgi:hypothetical protein
MHTLSNDAHSTVQINIRETDGAIQNGQSKETGKIGHTWHELFALSLILYRHIFVGIITMKAKSVDLYVLCFATSLYKTIGKGRDHINEINPVHFCANRYLSFSVFCLYNFWFWNMMFDKGVVNKGNNKITEPRTILQRESQNS